MWPSNSGQRRPALDVDKSVFKNSKLLPATSVSQAEGIDICHSLKMRGHASIRTRCLKAYVIQILFWHSTISRENILPLHFRAILIESNTHLALSEFCHPRHNILPAIFAGKWQKSPQNNFAHSTTSTRQWRQSEATTPTSMAAPRLVRLELSGRSKRQKRLGPSRSSRFPGRQIKQAAVCLQAHFSELADFLPRYGGVARFYRCGEIRRGAIRYFFICCS